MSAALVRFAGVYVTITLLLYAVTPVMLDWPIWARTAVIVPLMLVTIDRVVTPLVKLTARSTPTVETPSVERKPR